MPRWTPTSLWQDENVLGGLCPCGCGHFVKPGNKFIQGHNRSRLGKHLSEDTKRKMSEAKKGNKNPAKRLEVRIKISKALQGRLPTMLGKKHSEKSKRKMSISLKGRRSWNKGVPRTDEEKKKMSIANTGRTHSDLTKEKMRLSHLKMWQNPEYRESQIKAIFGGCSRKPTRPEKRLRKILNSLFPGEYKYVGDGKVWIGYQNPDFINVNGQKKIIEMFGDYWHSKPCTGIDEKKHEHRRIRRFAKYGFDTLVVWESELRKKSKLIRKIRKFTKQCQNGK